MAWIMDTYSMNVGVTSLGVVTGKPVPIGGSLGRATATGRGMLFIMRDYCKKIKKKLDSTTTIALQGFGNVGSAIGQFLHGQIAERRNPYKYIAAGLILSGIMNLFLGFWAGFFVVLLLLETCDGFFQAMGWSSIVRANSMIQ